jgi:uncharacterized protein
LEETGTIDSSARLCIHLNVRYEWDSEKANANISKHGVFFSDAVGVLEDEAALTIRDPYSDEEQRWIVLGMDLLGRVLVVVYAWRGESIRMISARHATPREIREYQAGGRGPSLPDRGES